MVVHTPQKSYQYPTRRYSKTYFDCVSSRDAVHSTPLTNGSSNSSRPVPGRFASMKLERMDLYEDRTASRIVRSGFSNLRCKAAKYHERTPFFRRLPGRAIAIILLIAALNLLVWVACGIVLAFRRGLVTTAVLSYTLGLRHALDADHISAIDLMTRRLLASGQRPVTVGTFFSLGHSTIVVITSIVVAASSAAISKRFGAFSEVGSIIGSSVSAGFLLLLGIMNAYILYKLYQQLERAVASPIGQETLDFNIEGGGCMMLMLRGMFRIVDKPWKMYPLGILFGLGFDASSEIALLGISSIEATQGTSFWLILLFPILFTAGMCLLDTFDGAAMMSLYSSARLAKDAIAVLYYQCVLTAITVVVAIVIGIIQLLNLIMNVKPNLSGKFWQGVEVAGDHYDIIGGAICGSFLVFGGLSVVLYRPWRTRVDRRRVSAVMTTDEDEAELEEVDLMQTNTPDSDRRNGDERGIATTVEDRFVGKASTGDKVVGNTTHTF